MRYRILTKRSGFTLVELTVVVGIVTVLISLLMPALTKVRKHAEEVHCAANLRSIGQALTAYTQQNGCYPGCWITDGAGNYGVWPVRLRALMGGDQGAFLCPSRDERFVWPKVSPEVGVAGRAGAFHAAFGYELGEPLLNFRKRPFSYGYNAMGINPADLDCRGLGWQVSNPSGAAPPSHPGWWREPRVSRVKSASQMIAVTDSDGDGDSDFVSSGLFVPNPRTPYRENPGEVHRGGANVLFCDGHVQWYRVKDLLVTYEANFPHEERARRMWNSDHEP